MKRTGSKPPQGNPAVKVIEAWTGLPRDVRRELLRLASQLEEQWLNAARIELLEAKREIEEIIAAGGSYDDSAVREIFDDLFAFLKNPSGEEQVVVTSVSADMKPEEAIDLLSKGGAQIDGRQEEWILKLIKTGTRIRPQVVPVLNRFLVQVENPDGTEPGTFIGTVPDLIRELEPGSIRTNSVGVALQAWGFLAPILRIMWGVVVTAFKMVGILSHFPLIGPIVGGAFLILLFLQFVGVPILGGVILAGLKFIFFRLWPVLLVVLVGVGVWNGYWAFARPHQNALAAVRRALRFDEFHELLEADWASAMRQLESMSWATRHVIEQSLRAQLGASRMFARSSERVSRFMKPGEAWVYELQRMEQEGWIPAEFDEPDWAFLRTMAREWFEQDGEYGMYIAYLLVQRAFESVSDGASSIDQLRPRAAEKVRWMGVYSTDTIGQVVLAAQSTFGS